MNRIIFSVVFSLLSISCNAKDKMNNIEIDNIVSNCISFTKNNMETYGNLWKFINSKYHMASK